MLGTLSVVTAVVAGTMPRALDPDHRRLIRVERDPRQATHDDIERLLRAHGVAESDVWRVCDRLEGAGVDASLVWAWTMQYDGASLASLVDQDLGDAVVLDHLTHRTLPVPRVRLAAA